jgi:hypothetical protein
MAEPESKRKFKFIWMAGPESKSKRKIKFIWMAEPKSKILKTFKSFWMAEPGHPHDVGVLHNRHPAAGTHEASAKR